MTPWPAHDALRNLIATCDEADASTLQMDVNLLRELLSEHLATLEASKRVALGKRNDPGRLEIAAMIYCAPWAYELCASDAVELADGLIRENDTSCRKGG